MLMPALSNMMCKSCTVDGCHVGTVTSIGVEQEGCLMKMHLDVEVTPETLEKIREYGFYSQIIKC